MKSNNVESLNEVCCFARIWFMVLFCSVWFQIYCCFLALTGIANPHRETFVLQIEILRCVLHATEGSLYTTPSPHPGTRWSFVFVLVARTEAPRAKKIRESKYQFQQKFELGKGNPARCRVEPTHVNQRMVTQVWSDPEDTQTSPAGGEKLGVAVCWIASSSL